MIGAGTILPADELRSSAIAPENWASHSHDSGHVLMNVNLNSYVSNLYGALLLVVVTHRRDIRKIVFDDAQAYHAHSRLDTTYDLQIMDFTEGILYGVKVAP